MTWLDWLDIAALLVALNAVGTAAIIGVFWFLSKPIGRGPERIVDIHNRGRTRIRMPDGTIK